MNTRKISREKDIPAQQSSSQENSRISQSHVHKSRPRYSQTSSPTRKKRTYSVNGKFPKSSRILNKQDFKKIRRFGKSILGKYFVVDFTFIQGQEKRLGLTVSKQFGKSCQRNRFKRIAREAFRIAKKDLPLGIQINLRPRPWSRKPGVKSHHLCCELINLFVEKKNP